MPVITSPFLSLSPSNRRQTTSRLSGFSLVELLLTVSLLGILAGLSVINSARFRRSAFNVAALSDYRNIKTVVTGDQGTDVPDFLFFNLQGPQVLPTPLAPAALSNGVSLDLALRFALTPAIQLTWIEVRAVKGDKIYRYLQFNGDKQEQVISLN